MNTKEFPEVRGLRLSPSRSAIAVCLLGLVVFAAQSKAESAVDLWGDLIQVQVPASVRLEHSGQTYTFRAAGEAGTKMQLAVRRTSRPGVRYAGELYFSEYEKIKKAGGYRVEGETSSGPSTGERCDIRYLIKPRTDRRRLHQVRAHYAKVGQTEWLEAVITIRSTAWNSAPAKALRRVLASADLGVR